MISLIVALHNEEHRFPAKFIEIREFLNGLKDPWEMILVDDGSTDQTLEMIQNLKQSDDRIRCFRLLKNLGQGAAVKLGVHASHGDVVIYTDADLSVPLSFIPPLIAHVKGPYDVAIASRWMYGATISRPQPVIRKQLGKVYYAIIHSLVLKDIHDTNCGLKAYKGDAARIIFGFVRSWRWAFNVESLWLAKTIGYKVIEVPVEWAHKEASKVHVFRDCIFTIWELLNIKLRQFMKIYPHIRL